MSKNIYKFHQVAIKGDDKLVIDNNAKVAKKIELLEEQLHREAASEENQEGLDGFSEGLDARQVEALVSDEAEVPMPMTENEKMPEPAVQPSVPVQEILEQAQKEAEEIKDSARREAQHEIEKLKKNAFEEGKTQGYETGYSEGMTQIETLRKNLESERISLEQDYEKMIDELEPKFVEALTGIYEKVFNIDLSKEHDIVMHLISSTMHKIEGSSNYLIHVSKEDYPYVSMKKEEILLGALSSGSSVEIVEDMTLGLNDCIIETDGGVFDCGLGTQLEELSQKLRLLSYTKE